MDLVSFEESADGKTVSIPCLVNTRPIERHERLYIRGKKKPAEASLVPASKLALARAKAAAQSAAGGEGSGAKRARKV